MQPSAEPAPPTAPGAGLERAGGGGGDSYPDTAPSAERSSGNTERRDWLRGRGTRRHKARRALAQQPGGRERGALGPRKPKQPPQGRDPGWSRPAAPGAPCARHGGTPAASACAAHTVFTWRRQTHVAGGKSSRRCVVSYQEIVKEGARTAFAVSATTVLQKG